MTPSESQLRADIVEVGRRLYARGYTASNDGNISARLDDRRLLMTPANVCKGFMNEQMMVITDLEGKKLAGERKPSSEIQMHLEVYRQRPEIQAVVHAHPPVATAFAVAGIPLDRAVLAEVVTTLGSVPIAEYATPSTKELPEAVRQVRQGARWHAAREPRRADAWQRRVCRLLQDGDDRAFRQHQLRGANARRRTAAVARRGDAAAGSPRSVWHRRPCPDLSGSGEWNRRSRGRLPGRLRAAFRRR